MGNVDSRIRKQVGFVARFLLVKYMVEAMKTNYKNSCKHFFLNVFFILFSVKSSVVLLEF